MSQDKIKREYYFIQQDYTTAKYIIPYINKFKKLNHETKVLEVACGEAGNLKSFIELGCESVGIDFNDEKIELGKSLMKKHVKDVSKLSLISSDIYDVDSSQIGQFDVVFLRDAIEHIPNQEKFIGFLKRFTKKDGVVFFGFPPWYMPFGGHQQGCKSILGKTPYFHILPNFLYKGILKLFGETDKRINSLLNTKSTGITIERFKKAVKQNDWKILDETLYLINPNYEVKFKLKPRKQFKLLGAIPFFRNFVTTCAYYIITPNK